MNEERDGVVYRATAEPMQFPDGDGRTMSGYAAVFNTPAHIVDRLGEYDEVIKPGAFKRSISSRSPEVMFQHGRHPLFGPYPLGQLTELREDEHGLFYSLRMTDTWLLSPIQKAIEARAITGSSISFEATKDGAAFTSQRDGGRLRTVRDAKLYELGPVVGPAYIDTTVGVRTIIAGLEDAFPGILQINISGTSEEPTLTRTSDEPADDSEPSDTSEPEPVEDVPERRTLTPAERDAYLRNIRLQRRGIRAETST